jgi:internalin A
MTGGASCQNPTVLPCGSGGTACASGTSCILNDQSASCTTGTCMTGGAKCQNPTVLPCGKGGIACSQGRVCIKEDASGPCANGSCMLGGATCQLQAPCPNNNGTCWYTISTYAGNGKVGDFGDNGLATSASLNNPQAIVLDSLNNLYIADFGNKKIKKVTPSGTITSLPIPSINAESLAIDSENNLYTVDNSTYQVVRINLSNNKVANLTTNSGLGKVFGIAIDSQKNIYVADSNDAIKKLAIKNGVYPTPFSVISGTAGSAGYADGGKTSAKYAEPKGIALDKKGNLYVADAGNSVIRKLTPDSNQMNYASSTIAGTAGTAHYSGDGGSASSAQINSPTDVNIDQYGNLYIAEKNTNVIRFVSSNNIITTIAGIPNQSGYLGDNSFATAATMNGPTKLTVDNKNNIYVVDTGNNVIRKLSLNGNYKN